MVFEGPCINQIEFIIDGTLLAPSNPGDIKNKTWINFRYINNLLIAGAGTLDGQGKESWKLNDCSKNPSCPILAMVSFLNHFIHSYNLVYKTLFEKYSFEGGTN